MKNGVNLFIWAVVIYCLYEMTREKRAIAGIGGIGAINYKSKFMPPYKQLSVPELGWKAETNFAFAQGKPGVYIIKRNGKIVYVGSSTQNVYAQMLRHFEPYIKKNSSTLRNLDYETRKSLFQSGHKKNYFSDYIQNQYLVRIILTNTANQSRNLERALIKEYKPSDNFIYNDGFDLFTNAEVKVIEEYDEVPF